MRKWCTEIKAVDPKTGNLLAWSGPYIEAPSQQLAQEYCDSHGLGYLRVTEFWAVEEIDEETGEKTTFEHYN